MSVKTIVHTDPTWYKVVAIIGLVFGAAAIAAVVLTQDDAVSELSASLSNRLNTHETTMKAQDTRIIKNENFNKMDATHLLVLQKTVEKLEEQNSQQQVDIAILKARGRLGSYFPFSRALTVCRDTCRYSASCPCERPFCARSSGRRFRIAATYN